jgi:4'-phosphopantetheinyl transferase
MGSAELARFLALDPTVRRRAFYDAWTRKEALVKGLGAGLSFPLARVDVSHEPRIGSVLLSVDDRAADSCDWSVISLDVPEGYSAAFAVQAPTGDIRLTPEP